MYVEGEKLGIFVIFPFPNVDLGIAGLHISVPKYAGLNTGEGEGHILVRTKVRRVNITNFGKKFKKKGFCFNGL